MQLHQKYFSLPNPYDPEANIKKGCEVLYSYGAKSNVNFDLEKWLICYNAGPGSLQKYLKGTYSLKNETKNYIKIYKSAYSRLVAGGGKPGATKTATVGGMVNPPSSAGDGWGDGSISSGENVDIDMKVWFELPNENVVKLQEKDLKNPNAGKQHSIIKKTIDSLTLGVSNVGTVSVKDEAIEDTSKSNQVKKSINNLDSSRKIEYNNKKTENVNNDPYTEINIDSLPNQAEFGIGEIDSLSDGELNFNRDKVSKIKDFSNDENITEKMYVDSVTYGQKGRLCRAFPSYLFLIVDEHNGWIDKRRFWSNYYLYQSVIEMQIHETDENPISTAKVVLTNLNRNIREYKKVTSLTELILGKDKKALSGDSDSSWYNQLSYKWFGSIINEEITDEMINLRNELWPEIYLREGLRIHIRLGYGSNPANYAPSFTGVITEIMDNGDLVTIAAQSDGAELVSTSVTDRTNATNKDIKLPEEPSDIIATLLCNRENEFLYQFTGGRFFLDNTYGISHFGFYSSGYNEGSLFVDSESQVPVAGGAIIGGAAGSVLGPAGAIGGAVIGSALTNIRRDRFEYDIVKNIYKGNYRGEYIYDPAFLWFDGEVNMRFFCYNRTPWDIMKMCEKMNPEFVCYPRPFGLENRIFFGLPWWQHKYRYERDDKNNKVYEFSKTFAQVNPINSFSDIIDNRIRVDTTNLTTNLIGIYSLGGDLASTPVIMSDIYIDRDKQSTKTIDTTSTQDFKGIPSIIDKALEWTGAFDNGKHNAIRVCLSELMESWKRTYSGNLVVIGSPEVRVHNYMYLSDSYANIEGTCKVREVVQSFGDMGYITTITPGLIAVSSLKNSGAPAIVKSISQVSRTAFSYTSGFIAQSIILNRLGSALSASQYGTAVIKYGKGALSFIKTKGFNIITFAKQGKVIAKLGSILSIAKNTLEGTRAGSAIITTIIKIVGGIDLAATGAVAIATVGLGIIATFIIGSLIARLITSITDMFKYNNCINVYPMYIENRPLLGGATGQKDLYPDERNEE